MGGAKPYYAVIFKSLRTPCDSGYNDMADRTFEAAQEIEGFLGADSVRDECGVGITVSYWQSPESIEEWKHNMLHMQAKHEGVRQWYQDYSIRICKVEYDNFFQK